MADKLTSNQQEALEWCRARESFLHVEFRRAGFTGPTIYSLRKRGLLEFDSATCRYRPLGVRAAPTPEPQMLCPRCKVDRFKQPCGDPHLAHCPMTGTAAGVAGHQNSCSNSSSTSVDTPGVAVAPAPGRAHRDLMLLAASDLEAWMKSYHRDAATEDLVNRLRDAACGVDAPDGGRHA